MRDRRVRATLVTLTLAFPVLMAAAAPARLSATRARSAAAMLGVEVVLVAGLMVAARERRLLAAERLAPAPPPLPLPLPLPLSLRVPRVRLTAPTPHVRVRPVAVPGAPASR